MSAARTHGTATALEPARAAFDPPGLLNPDKILPGGAGCGEAGGHLPVGARGPADQASVRAPAPLGGMGAEAGGAGPWR